MSSDKQQGITVIWQFQVDPERESAFTRDYGPEGSWVHLFSTAEGYLGTELFHWKFPRLTYTTLDSWISREAYEAFKAENQDAYAELDAKCEALTQAERFIGIFERDEAAAWLKAVRGRGSARGTEGGSETVRSATMDDVSALILLAQGQNLAAHWSEVRYREILAAEPNSRIALVVESATSKTMLGFVIGRMVADECELENIVVDLPVQRRGLALKLLNAFIAEAGKRNVERIFLEVREANTAARRLYEKYGFELVGRRKAYYKDPIEDAVLYRLALRST